MPRNLPVGAAPRPSGQSPHRPFTGNHILLLVSITLLAAVLRLYCLDRWSMWIDEAHSWRDATMPLWGDDFREGFLDSPRKWYPSTYLLLRWLLHAGLLPCVDGHAAEGWLRLPFAFCGIVTVPLLALVGNQFVGRRAALLAALFLAVNPWHIYFSQNVRGYVMVFFFATLAAGMFQLGSQRRSWGWRIGALLAVLVGASFHSTTLLLLAPFAAYPWLSGMQRLDHRFWIKVAVICLLAMLAAELATYLPPFDAFRLAKPDASLSHLLETTAYYFRVPLLLTAMVGVWLLFQTRLQGRILFLACWALVPLLALAVIGASVVQVTARYGLCALPAVMLLSGAGAVRVAEALVKSFARPSRWGHVVPALVLPVMLVLDMVSYDYLYFTTQRGDRGMWREAKDYVVAAAGGQGVAVYTINEPSMNFYLRPLYYAGTASGEAYPDCSVVQIEGWHMFFDPTKKDAPPWPPGAPAYLQRARARAEERHQELFLVVTLPELRQKDPDGLLRAAIAQQFDLVKVFPVSVGPKDETIYVYRVGRDAASLLLAQLRAKFGAVPPKQAARVRSAMAADLERFGVQLIGAESLDEALR